MGYVLDWQELEPSDEIGQGPQAANTLAGSVVSVVTWPCPTIGNFCSDEGNHPALS
ncbi:hypothetical protein SK854_12560 [Lentzea sp. BCCO 10_0061]|uniref:Uncharacterized protein n=1 Tax=Lentzea sokolovensis TaxID=3095429 RepID=A0ABU4UW30_9PSEU|nr:hypothetical protein [Lentzea sp. BCCO 10_0061]MDX8142951.1 hypothetical protein [Lentzea sp. BCCO 10_0061]